jgi:iron-sulfur cluster insertion protein
MIIFADAAALKVKEILELNPDYNSALDTNLNLRVLISGGGCSGFKYGFSLDEKKEDGDVVVENQGVKLVVDPISALYLDGAKIDYIESFESSHFEIRNPNVTSTCGCGSSFAV